MWGGWEIFVNGFGCVIFVFWEGFIFFFDVWKFLVWGDCFIWVLERILEVFLIVFIVCVLRIFWFDELFSGDGFSFCELLFLLIFFVLKIGGEFGECVEEGDVLFFFLLFLLL